MGLGIDRFRWSVDFSRRSRVSEIVDEGECVRTCTSASIAAIGMVMSGSDRRNSLYVATMLRAIELTKGLKITQIKNSLKWLRAGRSRPLCNRRHDAARSYRLSRVVEESRFLWAMGLCLSCLFRAPQRCASLMRSDVRARLQSKQSVANITTFDLNTSLAPDRSFRCPKGIDWSCFVPLWRTIIG